MILRGLPDPSRARPATRASVGAGFRARRSLGVLCLAALGSLFEITCASQGTSPDDDIGDAGDPGDRDKTTIRLDGVGQGGDSGARINPLCGLGPCDTDTNEGCSGPVAPSGGQGGEGGQGGAAGSQPGGAPNSGNLAGAPTSQAERNFGEACRVSECSSADCELERRCALAGSGGELAPCLAASDCAAGLTCVGEGKVGVCRRFCCRPDTCGEGAFCEEGRELDTGLTVPVCAPLTVCSTQEPFPCPKGAICTCGADRACAIVTNDGQTACVVPGAARQGEGCSGFVAGECAAGHVCSRSLGCLEVCSLGAQGPCGATGFCQAPAEFPAGLGVCVGGDAADAAL